ncbi:MAG: MFS transporter [Reyranella sp.]|nr:MFS transporter [Reyranella sp.]
MTTASPRGMAVCVLALCFVMGLVGRGLPDSFAVYVVPLSNDFGWDRAEVVSIYSFYAVASALAGPLIGRLFDRSGPRTVYLIGITLLGGSFALAGFAQSLWQLQATIGLGVGIAVTCLGNITNTALLSRWYGSRLVFATSIVFSGYGLGIFTLVPLSQLLIDAYDWRGAYLRLGLGILLLLIPLILLPWSLIRAGDPRLIRATAASSGTDMGLTLLSAIRGSAFWGLFWTLFFTSLGMFAILVEVIAYLRDVGFDPLFAATAWGFSGALLPLGMLAVSGLDAVIGRRRAVLLTYVITLTGLGFLWLLRIEPSVWLLGGFVVCCGATLGSRSPLISATAMHLFRGRSAATIFGCISVGAGAGQAIGAWIGGLLHDWTGGYDAVIGFSVVSLLLAMAPFLTLRALRG